MPQNSPIFSIVIPTYNRAHLIGKTIESMLRQEFQDFEILVVDDGSKRITPATSSKHSPIHASNILRKKMLSVALLVIMGRQGQKEAISISLTPMI